MTGPDIAAEWSEVECPACGQRWAWLGDQGASVELHGRCLQCLLLTEHPGEWGPGLEAELDAKVAQVVALRESREQATGRRVFPCVRHALEQCPSCGGRGWVAGYPPGAAPPA
jgi:hypothetical protein